MSEDNKEKDILQRLDDMSDDELLERLENADDAGLTRVLGTPDEFLGNKKRLSVEEIKVGLENFAKVDLALTKVFPDFFINVEPDSKNQNILNIVSLTKFDDEAEVESEFLFDYKDVPVFVNEKLGYQALNEKMLEDFIVYYLMVNNQMESIDKNWSKEGYEVIENGLHINSTNRIISWQEVAFLVYEKKVLVFSFEETQKPNFLFD